MTASALPAALMMEGMSCVVPPSAEAFRVDELVEMPESMEALRGTPFASARDAVEGPAMASREEMVAPARGFGVTTESETLRWSFERRDDAAGGLEREVRRWITLAEASTEDHEQAETKKK